MTRRSLLILSTLVGLPLAVSALLAQPRVAWELERAVAFKQHQAGRAIDYPALTHTLGVYLDSNPSPARGRKALRTYFSMIENAGVTEDQLRALASHPNREISYMAEAKLRRLALMSEPVQLRFVALDGRMVDLQEFRGRVVLLDFWASWCPSCMKELPHLKSVYDKYHDRGFEIVGIALDEAHDEQKVTALLRRENLRWPQYFSGDGHYMTSELSKRFGVTGIPATFLLDRKGMIADMGVRGERLEPAVSRLLAMHTAGEEAAADH